MPAEENIALIRRTVQAVNENDTEAIRQLAAPEFAVHYLAQWTVDPTSADQVVEVIQQMRRALPDFRVEIQDIFATDDRVAMRVVYSGTHQGELLGTAPTGKRVEYHSINLYRIDDGKLAESWQLPDIWGLLQQIGAVPPLGG